MVTDKTEEEQVEAIKNWFQENGTSLIVGIVLALGGVFGYQSWQTSVQESGEEASALYEDLMQTINANAMGQLDEETVSTGRFITDQLKTDYSDSTYAHFAAMSMAKIAAQQGDLERAESELRWVMDNGVEESIELITRQRLARVLLGRDKPEEALSLLEDVDAGAHTSSYEEVKGDIYVAMGREDEAQQAYRRALDTTVADTDKPILGMKLGNLAEPETVIPDKPVEAEGGDTGTDEAENTEAN